jgi:hypothetical protein
MSAIEARREVSARTTRARTDVRDILAGYRRSVYQFSQLPPVRLPVTLWALPPVQTDPATTEHEFLVEAPFW